MVKRSIGMAWVLLATVVGPSMAQSDLDIAVQLRDQALEDSMAWDLVESLTSEVGPRFAGSEGDRRGVEWAVAKLTSLGFDRVWTDPIEVPQWDRGQAEGQILGKNSQSVHLTALGGSIGTPENGLEAEVIEVASQEVLETLGRDDLEGKIVFVNHPMQRRQDSSDYGNVVKARGMAAWTASKSGALAVLVRSVGTGPHRFPHTGAMRRVEGQYAPIPGAALAVPDADILSYQLGLGAPIRFRLKMTSRMLASVPSANVIAEMTGSEKPDEVVVLAAHLDSWDLGTGAIDDGAGCAITMAAAKMIGDLPQRPKRTIRVFLAGNEEFGLTGARAYAKKYQSQLENHYVVFESDLGADRIWRFNRRFGPAGEALAQRMYSLLEPLGIENGDNEARGGPDLSPLREHLVPAIDLVQDGTYYFDYHHTADDTLDKIDPEQLRQNVAAFVGVAYLAAQAEEELRPIPVYPARE